MFKKITALLLKPNLSVQLILIFALSLILGPKIPEVYKAFLYSISLSMKQILLFLLPFIIFTCLFNGLVQNRKGAFRFVGILLVAVCISNFFSIIASYVAAVVGLSSSSLAKETQSAVTELAPLWSFKIPSLVSNEMSLICGVILGLFFAIFPNKTFIGIGEKANHYVSFFLQKIFVPLLPIFALGFIVKMEHEGILRRVIETYTPIILLMVVANVIYISLMFGIAAKFNPKRWLEYIKNVLPAGILGFSTMSSMATMPVTLKAAEENTKDPEMARAIIPATVNIHMIGDSISMPLLAMAVSLTFGHSLPTFSEYLLFTQFFMLTKFAVPGIPCGTIFVMIPILEKYMGYTPEMSAFIAAIYILFDSIITATNVLGNSAFVIIMSRIMKVFRGTGKETIGAASAASAIATASTNASASAIQGMMNHDNSQKISN